MSPSAAGCCTNICAPAQAIAIGCAALGGDPGGASRPAPWIALLLALTFGLRLAPQTLLAGPLPGSPWKRPCSHARQSRCCSGGTSTGEGRRWAMPVPRSRPRAQHRRGDAIPLLLFAYGARRIRLTTLGLLQYIAPTVQFTLGWPCSTSRSQR